LSGFKSSFDDIRIIGRHPYECVGRTYPGDGTFVAVDTKIVSDLQMQGAISECRASFNAFGTADAKVFIDAVFIIRFFNKLPFNGGSRTKLVFCCSVSACMTGYKISSTKITITTEGICMHTLYGRGVKHTMCGTPAATAALEWIYLPYPLHGGAFRKRIAQQSSQTKPQRITGKASYELPSVMKFAHGVRVLDDAQLSALPQAWQALLPVSPADPDSGLFERARKPIRAITTIRITRPHLRVIFPLSICYIFILV
jgi:hypothetical protein